MNYNRLAKKEEFIPLLTKVDTKKELKKSGIPMLYINNIYIDDTDTHNLVIGDTGSGKTQSTILPLIRTSIRSNDSVLVNDVKGELYQKTAKEFEKKGYKIIILDFKNNEIGNCWNPFALAYKLYKEGKEAESTKLIEEIGFYLMYQESSLDSFWLNSAKDYFVGLVLYLFNNAKEEEINLNSIFSLSSTINEENNLNKFLNKLDKNSNTYYYLSGTLTSPKETRGGVVSTFIERIKRFISNKNISNLLSISDFDITNITKEKTAIFITSGISDTAPALIPLLVTELLYVKDNYEEDRQRFNIILDEFDELNPIYNLPKILHYSRGLGMRFTIYIRSFKSMETKYGKNTKETITATFGNIIYLWSSDLETSEEISKLCGNKIERNKQVPLISVEELKTLKKFETIILKVRMHPLKTQLLPDYKLNWNMPEEEYKTPKIKNNNLKIYNIKL